MKKIDKEQTIEQKVASAILQKNDAVVIAGRTFLCGRPTLGDLIEMSAVCSTIPEVNVKAENIVIEALRVAKDSAPLAEIVAILVRGTKGMRSAFPLRRFFARLRIRRTASWLIDNATNQELREVAIQRIAQTQAGDFFGLIAFLGEVNLTKATKETETTVSGQQSELSPSGTE